MHQNSDSTASPGVDHGTAGSILVMGAGAVGCFLGGRLQAAGVDVRFVGRPRVTAELRIHGLTLTDLDGGRCRLAPQTLRVSDDIPPGLRPDLVILAVKGGSTSEAARALGAALPAGTVVVSMQNGLSNVSLGRQAAPALRWLAGMVPFNVARTAAGHFHRGTEGELAVQDDPAVRAVAGDFARAGLPLRIHADLRPVQWGKLLLNLNNPVNALSGLPLRAQLLDRGYRQCLAALQTEALEVLRHAGIRPAQVAALPARRLPALLRLPTPVFRLIAARMLRIDASARSSMADDFAMHRTTEIDALCGEVVRLAQSCGTSAPLNARMVELVQAWPARPVPMASRDLRAALRMST